MRDRYYYDDDGMTWRYTIHKLAGKKARAGEPYRYDAYEETGIWPEHRVAVALLMAVYPDVEDAEVSIPGVGEITNFGESGPLIGLENW